MFVHLRNIPARAAAGGYVLHTGLEKWNGNEEQAKGLHAFASGAFPFLSKVQPGTFLKALSVAEISTGVLLLTPVVPNKIAGAVLTAFSSSLLTVYMRTPALHEEGSVWPTQAGIALSKDVWMLGIGLGLIADDATDALGKHRNGATA
ncbi:MAG TPA: hypothetical protein VGH96_20990 [Streptosporangiaceae bacterium]|jgi:uncharacterized membrane protein YkgB